METLRLLPLSQSELHGGTANWIDTVFAGSVPKLGLPLTGSELTETSVYGELLKHVSSGEGDYELFYYRDHDKLEVDFVLENATGDTIGVEVKSTATIKADDLRGLHRFSEAVGPRFKKGIVLYDGTETVPLSEHIRAVPLSTLWGQ